MYISLVMVAMFHYGYGFKISVMFLSFSRVDLQYTKLNWLRPELTTKRKITRQRRPSFFFLKKNSGIFLLNIKKIRQALKNSLIILLNLTKLVNIETSQPDSLSRSSIK